MSVGGWYALSSTEANDTDDDGPCPCAAYGNVIEDMGAVVATAKAETGAPGCANYVDEERTRQHAARTGKPQDESRVCRRLQL